MNGTLRHMLALITLLATLAGGCHTQHPRDMANTTPPEANNLSALAQPNDSGGMTYRQFHDNGQLMSLIQTDSGGALHGTFRTWYLNGRPHVEANYDHGFPDGLVTEWDSEGNITYQQRWSNRVPVN